MNKTTRINLTKNKKTISSLALILLLAISLMMPFTQTSLAQVGISQPEKTVGYISVAPSLVGVDQPATVNLWVYPMPTNYKYAPYYKGYTGIEVTFIKPDGTEDTFMPIDGTGMFTAGQTESLGIIYFNYEPDMAGNWSVYFTMPAQNLTDASGTVLYSACTSMTAYFTVQEEPVNAGLLNGYPWSPLPDENTFWDYPISPNNREWWAVSGDWLGITAVNGAGSRYWQPYGYAPNTAHIVWTSGLKAGGLIGGDYGSISYSSGMNLGQAVMMEGRAYVAVPNTNPAQFECIDLTSGEVLYKAAGSISGGVHVPGNAYTQSGYDASVVLASSYGSIPTPYLYGTSGTTWNYYDPYTGTLMRSIVNASSAKLVDGTPMAYGVAGGYYYAWNMSKVVNNNWPTGVTWKLPLPTPVLNGSTAFSGAISLLGITVDGSVLLLKTANEYWGYSAKDGSLIWHFVLDYPTSANQQIALYGVDDFIVFDPVETTFHCYSIKTGEELWVSQSYSDSPWATTWTVYISITSDYDNLYVQLPDGTMTAISLETGKTLWRSEAIASTEYTNNAVPFVIGMAMVGGNLYGYAGYSVSYQLDPIPRFAMLVCINATTGDITYTLNGGIYPTAASDGILLGLGEYDGLLYGLGKGQTSTTVSAPQTAITSGTAVTIVGSVLDQSAAQPNTAAISDADMSVWMDYMHMQNATLLNNPPECTGVPVTLTAVDPNGNTVTIGTTTSNYQGNYGFQWTPTISGMYTIYANFEGSDSYYKSSASTYATVVSAASTPAPTTTQSALTNSDVLTYFATGVVVIIVAIAVATVLMLRKKP